MVPLLLMGACEDDPEDYRQIPVPSYPEVNLPTYMTVAVEASKDVDITRQGRFEYAVSTTGTDPQLILDKLAGAFNAEYSDGLAADAGHIKWVEKANVGYYPQDHENDFDVEMNLTEWMRQWGQEGDDEQVIRGTLGRLLFGSNDVVKQVQVLSGGEKGRMLYGKLILLKPNVLVMDEPTNHMDMESIESLNMALEKYPGTLIFVSHDRQFVSSLATQIIELDGEGGFEHHLGDYEGYLAKKGLV